MSDQSEFIEELPDQAAEPTPAVSVPKDGGPAFPRPASTDEHSQPCNVFVEQAGMSLRDWFAGQALAGISGHLRGALKKENETTHQADARWAYRQADAMLAERDRKP